MTQFYNRYTYAINNPLVYIDQDGELPIWAIIGIVAGFAYLKAAHYNTPKADQGNPLKWNWLPWNWDWKNATYTVSVGNNTGPSGGIGGAIGVGWDEGYFANVGYNQNSGIGIGYTTPETGTNLFYPEYDYNKPEKAVNEAMKNAHNEYLVYNGTRINWYDNNNNIITSYNATSGLPNYQNSQYQKMKDRGPIPAGTYKIDLSLNSEREASVYDNSGELKPGQGIERIPDRYVSTSGTVYSYPGWGQRRAKLTPVSGNMYGRGAFYIHDSHKGYTHGCIEVDSRFFNRLINYGFFNSNINILDFRK